MSFRNPFSNLLLIALLLAPIPTLVGSMAQAGDVSRIHSEAKEGQFVMLEGRVTLVREKRFFTLEDASGSKIVTVIPNHLQRTDGTPKVGETIRVRGKYDHKTFVDVNHASKVARDQKWGIRVHSMDRNLSTSGRNPRPDPAMSNVPSRSDDSPAAPLTAVTIATPDIAEELKVRMATSRKQALATREALAQAKTEVARGVYRKAEGAEQAELAATEERAQQAYDEAIGAIRPLAEEARKAGLDPKLIELYEAGLTRPPR